MILRNYERFICVLFGDAFFGRHGETTLIEERAYSLLQYDVDRDVLFVERIPASPDKPNEAADGDQAPERKSGALDESVVFDLVNS
mgnify:FL=1